MPIQTGDNKFSVAQWIVDPVVGLGTHTTIGAAITAASSGETIFIRPGTYVENLTLKGGVNLASFTADGMDGQVVIQGKLSNSTASLVSISGIQIETNGDFGIENTSTGGIILTNCRLLATDNTFFSNSGAAEIQVLFCIGDIQALGITLAALTNGSLRVIHSIFFNTASSTTVSTFADASLFVNFSALSNAFQISGTTGEIQGSHALFVPNINLTAIDLTSTSANPSSLTNCDFNTGNQPAITIGAGATYRLTNSSIRSTAANAVTGAGTFQNGNLTFTNTASISVGANQPLNVGNVYLNSQQPAFLAESPAALNVTGAGTTYTLGSGGGAGLTAIINQGNYLSLGDGAGTGASFVAPFTGTYLLGISVRLAELGAANTLGTLTITTSNRTYSIFAGNVGAIRGGTGFADGLDIGGTVLADMDASDTASFSVAVFNGAGDTVDVSASVTKVWGKLVC